MNLRNIQLVCRRELQDQLRDHRTLFMVVVLPLLMYPLMGTSFFQLSQFMRGHTASVLLVGSEQLGDAEGLPPLLGQVPPSEEGDRASDQAVDATAARRFAKTLFNPPTEARRINVALQSGVEVPQSARDGLSSGDLDVVILLPAGFASELEELRSRLQNLGERPTLPGEIRVPQPVVLFNSLRESSRIARLRVDRLLDRWQQQIVRKNLVDSGAPEGLAKPFQLVESDVAQGRGRFVGLWSMLLPFVAFVWALTGAFYPAIDLCAGEKERGTLETLLASPASRNEIVWGKLLTVAIFSMVTAVLNLIGMATTSQFIAGQLGAVSGMAGLSAPPLWSLVWLLVALPPLSALFGALSLACASFARSTKEGQYYFMPLFLGLLPLMMMPMAPGVELNLGNSLVPVMGLVLVLQALLEQRIAEAAPYILPVTLVTFGCCLLAIKWAVSQFNQESVLFRESERFDLRLWLLRAVRDRVDTPTGGLAVLAIGTIFGLQFFAKSILSQLLTEQSLSSFTLVVVVSQACIVVPVLLFAWWLTRRPAATLLLDRAPKWWFLPLGAVLAISVHPLGMAFASGVQQLYPLDPEALAALKEFAKPLSDAEPWQVLLLTAVLPAFCEEIAFRGFLLTGLRKSLGTAGAVVMTSVAFGLVHTVLQQSLGAVFLGLLLGYLAVTTRSLWPGIIFHGFYNSLSVLVPYYAEGLDGDPGWVSWLRPQVDGAGVTYPPLTLVAGLAISGLILWRIASHSGAGPAGRAASISAVGEARLAGDGAE